ncbi:MAG: hypothetical protein VW498_02170 [Candidatus Thalassarchaeaceae archaeon]
MPKPLSEEIKAIIKSYDIDHREALWDCHGTWVMYHRYIEMVAVKANIKTKLDQVLQSSETHVAIAVSGEMDGRTEWSFGEASPKNCKNAYLWAMAEKRAKDRVILKLVGLAGHVYSEDDIADKDSDTPFEINEWDAWADEAVAETEQMTTDEELDTWKENNLAKFSDCQKNNKKAAQRIKAARDKKTADISPIIQAAE